MSGSKFFFFFLLRLFSFLGEEKVLVDEHSFEKALFNGMLHSIIFIATKMM
jgi:hypothetical protein